MRTAILWWIVALSACGGSREPSANPTSATEAPSVCEELARLCHEHDNAGTVAHECHVLGHSKQSSEAECSAKRPQCLEACRESKTQAEQGHSTHGH
jgi:hypothetical protein